MDAPARIMMQFRLHAVQQTGRVPLAVHVISQTCALRAHRHRARTCGQLATQGHLLRAFSSSATTSASNRSSSPHSILSASSTCAQRRATSPPRRWASIKFAAPRLPSQASANTGLTKTKPINPPDSTLPAPIDLPAKPENEHEIGSRFKYYFALGKAYVTFYKTGVKNVWYNYKQAKELTRKAGIKLYGGGAAARQAQLRQLATGGKMSRADFQLLERVRADTKVLPIFALILLICGEFTPFVVLAIGKSVVPRTCHIPNQVEKADQVHLGHQRRLYQSDDLMMPPAWVVNATSEAVSKGQSDSNVMQLSLVLGLSGRDRTWITASGLGSMALSMWYRPRLARHLGYLELDDAFLRQSLAGTQFRLSDAELKVAANERGIIHTADNRDAVTRNLEAWLRQRANLNIPR